MSFGVSASADSCTPGALMPLCSSSSPPSTHGGHNLVAVGLFDLQLNLSVVEQEQSAGARLAHELRVGRVDVLGHRLRRRLRQSGSSRRRCSSTGRRPFSRPVRIFGPLRSCSIDTTFVARAAAARILVKRLGVRLVSAVRKIQPADVDAGVMSCSMIASLRLAGPIVAMIFV